jgi:hypothetical protein
MENGFGANPEVVVIDQVFVVSSGWEGVFVAAACAGVFDV